MINIAIDTATGTAKPSQYATIKAGSLVPVTIAFSSAPGALPLIELALSGQGDKRGVVAYLGAFERQNATLYTGWLDATDARLHTLLAGKTLTVDCEVIWIVDGRRQVAPNFPIVVQPPIVTGPEQSEGGPRYYTGEQIEALLGDIGLQKSATHIQWRYLGGPWTDLVALDDLKGEKGVAEPESINLDSASGVVPVALSRFAVVSLTLADNVILEQSGASAPGSVCNIHINNTEAHSLSWDSSIKVDWCDEEELPLVPPDGCVVSLIRREGDGWKGAWRA